MAKAESIQYQAALVVTSAWQGSRRSKLYEELRWEALSDRRMCRRILQIHNIINNKTPSYLTDKLPPIRVACYNPNHNYCDIFQELRNRPNRYMYSFFPNATTSWNNIMKHFQNTSPFNTLKDHIISLVRPKSKSIFGIHDPLRLRYLFQLRVKLSPLRSHKKHHNFIDTPSETCHCNLVIEDVSHFLLACLSYANERATLAIGNQSELYLYGHQSIDVIDNRKILLSTIKYIKDTQHFAT